MNRQITYEERLYTKLHEQIRGKRVGFLLGAGASYLNGAGYPLSSMLWLAIKNHMAKTDQRLIEEQIADNSVTLEQALDAIDRGQVDQMTLRDRVTTAIAAAFIHHNPPLDVHREFIARLRKRSEKRIPIFTLNYDPLVELAADREQAELFDGFNGTVECFFQPSGFTEFRGILESRRGRSVPVQKRGVINLYKLHGSLGWFVDSTSKLKRIRPDMSCPPDCRHLMLPPQNRKAADTGATPYATLWSEFRAHLANESTRLLNRLVCVGYGLGDGHVNAVIESGLTRKHFILVVLAKALDDLSFERWRQYPNAIVVTETRSSLYGEKGTGLRDAWAFEWLVKEI